MISATRLVDIVLLLTGLEVLALAAWRWRTGTGPRILTLSRVLLPGICLILGMRAALAGMIWPFVPVSLIAALVAHLLDLRARWRE